jgi:hypothetical protein
MKYLLLLNFGMNTALLPYPSLETCQSAATYYHEKYGKDLITTDCEKVEDEDEKVSR